MASDLQSVEKAYAGLSLHDKAVVIESWTEKLATELAHAGVDENTVGVLSKIADVMRRLVSALGKGQEQTGDEEPPAPEEPAEPPQDIQGATQQMHQEMVQRARTRAAS